MSELQSFSKRLNTTPEVKEIMKQWKIKLEPDLEKLNGNLLLPEEIVPGAGKKTFRYGKKKTGARLLKQ